MDTIVLRKLAWKSTLDFGKHEGRTVQQVFDLEHTRILRWYYYNLSKISFIPEVLRAIGITEEYEIQKPGKDPDKGKELDALMDKKMRSFYGKAFHEGNVKEINKIMKQKRKIKARKGAEAAEYYRKDSVQYSDGRLQWKNQGHKSGE